MCAHSVLDDFVVFEIFQFTLVVLVHVWKPYPGHIDDSNSPDKLQIEKASSSSLSTPQGLSNDVYVAAWKSTGAEIMVLMELASKFWQA